MMLVVIFDLTAPAAVDTVFEMALLDLYGPFPLLDVSGNVYSICATSW